VSVIEINAFDVQRLERPLSALLDKRRVASDRVFGSVPEFRGQEDFGASAGALEPCPDELFAVCIDVRSGISNCVPTLLVDEPVPRYIRIPKVTS